MRTLLGFGLALSAVLAATGCASEATVASGAEKPTNTPNTDEPKTATTTSALEQTSCRFVIPRSVEGTKVTCYDLTVPESRRPGAAAKTIKIHLARVKGQPGGAGVPTIELMGGPGGGSDGMVGALVAGAKDLEQAYGPILAKGDLIVFDQRGVGRSLPRLGCPRPATEDAPEPTTADCKTALEAQGIDLAAYDTIENADDVHDMKVALGVDKIDLHGISYGTRLGLEILKRHPNDVRSAILDGVMPPDVPVMGMFPVTMDTVLSRTFAACKADAKCNRTYPDLEGTIVKLKDKLEKTPFKAHDYQFGVEYDYDWSAFFEELIGRSYEEGTAARVPHWITSLLTQTQEQFEAAAKKAEDESMAKYDAEDKAAKENPLLAEYLEAMSKLSDADYEAMDMAQGMYLSVTCNDYAQHEKIADAQMAQSKIRKVFQDEKALESEFGDCAIWPTRTSEPTLKAPATFGGPVLVIGGDQDPATPIEWARQAASTLPASTLIDVPTGGHGLMDACGAGLKGSFFGDPSKALDTTCATKRTIEFYYEGPNGGFRDATRVHATSLAPMRPAATLQERLAERVLTASTPTVVNQTAKLMKALAARH